MTIFEELKRTVTGPKAGGLKAESLHCVVQTHRVDAARTFISQGADWQIPVARKAYYLKIYGASYAETDVE